MLGNGKNSALLLGGHALLEDSLELAGRIAAASGARVLSETFVARMQRGAGRFGIERLQYFSEHVTEHAPAHDWLMLTGGAIGQGLPLSLGAAIACPDQKVIALQADGSAMYTEQALWTMARENTDVTVVIMNNRSYAILNIELARVGAGQPTPKTLSMLDLSRPDIDWVKLSEGMGVPATKATTAEEFHRQFEQAMSEKGPCLIEAMVVQQIP